VKLSRLFFSLLLSAVICGHGPDAFAKTSKKKKSSSLEMDAVRAMPAGKAKQQDDDDDDDDAPAQFALPATPAGTVPNTHAAAVIVIDARTGEVLYEKNADAQRQAASTQKLLTSLIVAERGFLDRPVTVMPIDTYAEPTKLNIKAGETYQRIDLLRALLVKSPNDVARCLARDNAGSIEAFAQIMNRRARELGATNSNFVNPNGLPMPGQYSTARDLSLIARAAYANPTIRSIVCLPKLVFRYANGRTRELENTNKLLLRLPYCNGMKTGYTDAAGKCLISSGTRPGRDVIAVVLGESRGRVWQDSAALLSWALWM
jgi:D-alanyl-D-alanine carboxypeptidase (penicillin-binding protein 5/6)